MKKEKGEKERKNNVELVILLIPALGFGEDDGYSYKVPTCILSVHTLEVYLF